MKYPIIYEQNGGTLNQMTFVTFNVYGGGKLFEQRKVHENIYLSIE